ncbi:ABC transporter ATP-binding protein [Lederbergia citrea]|uniref:ABC transporter ATP-binding protein n=1 Tax=Lederbergia citrea TaxID=2833581 RepID=A0A942Z345_9BACI|nr:ABC transporter ATP-binding protein [Lederbergia citrea]MBS4203195.1 ABC transporter ATP-binding protein [Lederbergia citrea]MBS4222134.1 ABC transporter ATP-binding protein [Lederbergia citrea]
MTSFIKVEGLYKSFGQQTVLENVNFRVKKGEIVGLLGPNGAGKTTFIRILNGVIKPEKGSILLNGMDPASRGDAIRKISGIVTESAGLYHQMSGKENLELFAELYGVTDKNRVTELLDLFDLNEHRDKPVGKYSTGMKKRLALAKALLHKPDILFLDEPTNGLDPDGIRMVLSYLKNYNQETGTTVIICSHVLHQLETICDSFAFIDNGTIAEQGTLIELEDKYVQHVTVKVKTTFKPKEKHYLGFPCRVLGESIVVFDLPTKNDIPHLLIGLLKTNPVYSVTIMNNDLQSIYFKVRGYK